MRCGDDVGAYQLSDLAGSGLACLDGGFDRTNVAFNNRCYETTADFDAFDQFDGYVTSAATTKLVQATNQVANEYGYDLVIRKKDVIMYRNPATINDITELVKAEIKDYL